VKIETIWGLNDVKRFCRLLTLVGVVNYRGVGYHSLLHLVFLSHILKRYIQFDSAFNSAQIDVFDIKIYLRVPE
jgi:hypothetical protein